MLSTKGRFLDRFERAARSGFEAVEFLIPYAPPAADIKAQLSAHRLQLVLHNLPAGDWDAGERGIACLPDRVDEFNEGVERAIEYATTLGVANLNCLVGKAPSDISDSTLRRTLVLNLRYAAAKLSAAGLN